MFNLSDYEPVEVRLEKFIADHKDFRISTELEVVDSNRYIVKAYLYKNATDTVAWATGLAEETVTSRGVNQTSALENCETSAIGRAIANCPLQALVIADPHVGKYAWGEETGWQDYDIGIAKRLLKASAGELLAEGEYRKVGKRAIFLLGDYFHYDTPDAKTTKGTPLERDVQQAC